MPFVLDGLDGITIPYPDESKYGNELRRLYSLGEGLCFLYRNVAKIESEQSAKSPPGFTGSFTGKIEGVPFGLMECGFHWYATTICNYCRLVGHIAHELGIVADKTGLDYTRRICRQAYTYRNKVSAHFARYWPDPKDTEADIQYSAMNFPSLVNGRFRTGTFRMTVTKAGKQSSTSHDTDWSLTELHEELSNRFGTTFCPRKT